MDGIADLSQLIHVCDILARKLREALSINVKVSIGGVALLVDHCHGADLKRRMRISADRIISGRPHRNRLP